jgi:hypothetical protein
MLAEAETTEYLAEIREQVCSHCVERPEGGPPCTARGKVCGIELHLPQLIEAIHQVDSGLLDPYLQHNRQNICERCTHLHSSSCACPMDYLALLLVQAVETVDQRRGWEPLQPEPEVAVPASGMTHLQRITRACEEAQGKWSGCDWPTSYGRMGLDLNGWTAAEARYAAARAKDSEEREVWTEAAIWLARLEAHSRWAEQQATLAVADAKAGRWETALQRIRWARALEFATGRNLRRSESPTWDPLCEAIEAAAKAQVGKENEPDKGDIQNTRA